MPAILIGRNFSGRSEWLAERRGLRPWPQSALLGPTADLACTGLASTVRQELAVAEKGGQRVGRASVECSHGLDLREILDHHIYTLSGGEAVRVALASLAAQEVAELQIDTALEQLDEQWRRSIFGMLGAGKFGEDVFIADNHLSLEEERYFKSCLQFPPNLGHWPSAPVLDPVRAASHVAEATPLPIVLDDVSFAYTRRLPLVLKNVSLKLEPGRLYLFMGPNGSGKTTLVKLLSGTVLPRRGVIFSDGLPFRPGRSRGRFASLSFQNPDYQWTSQSVIREFKDTNVPSGGTLQAILPDFGVPAELLMVNPNELPFVFKKRIGIALSLLASKSWCILDEPTLGQDHDYRFALADLVGRILRYGKGVLIVSHDAYFRALFADARELRFHDQTVTSLNANPITL